jgi:hypothetical protein
MQSPGDKRFTLRAEMNSDAVVYLGGEQIPCRTLNISLDGMALSSPVRRRVDSPLKVNFLIPDGYGWVEAQATLVRDARYYGSFVWGIEFGSLDENSKKLVQEYVDENLPYLAFA